jgi:predicted DsbA family dithiol-disulfide isomerase
MKNMLVVLAALLICSTGVYAKDKASDDSAFKKEISAHPQVLLDFIKEHRKEVFEIVSQAAQEENERRRKEEEEQEKKDFDESFKNPKKPTMPDVSRIRGNKDAKYTLVEYSDFECPYCGRGYQTVEELRKKYGNDLRFVYKNLPLPMHAHAMQAAKYYEAAALQSVEKSWAFHDKMFQNQRGLNDEFFKKTGKELGLDVKKLEEDAASQKVMDKINADMEEARSYGFSGTPGFLLNGVPVRGAYPVDYFDMIVKRLASSDKDAKN